MDVVVGLICTSKLCKVLKNRFGVSFNRTLPLNIASTYVNVKEFLVIPEKTLFSTILLEESM